MEHLYEQARASNKRLVLCGHSLGGAVALLCTIKVLRMWAARQLGGRYTRSQGDSPGGELSSQQLVAAAAAAAAAPFSDPNVRCITFAAPAVANEALAAEVVASGWDRLISNFVQPEDQIVPFVNMLLKAEPGSAALERTVKRLAANHTAAAVAARAAAHDRRAARANSARRNLSSNSSISSSMSASASSSGSFTEAAAAVLAATSARLAVISPDSNSSSVAPQWHAFQRGRMGALVAVSGAFSHALALSASATASIAAAVAAAAHGSVAELHSRLLEDSAYKHTAAVVSLAMVSACNLPAAETLGNAPHAPEAAQRLLHHSKSVLAFDDSADHDGTALMPSKHLQGGLPTSAFVIAAEAGVIGLLEVELAELAPEHRRRVGGPGWLVHQISSWQRQQRKQRKQTEDKEASSSSSSGSGSEEEEEEELLSDYGWKPFEPREQEKAAGGEEGDGCAKCTVEREASAWDVRGSHEQGEVDHERRAAELRTKRLQRMRRTHSAFECVTDVRHVAFAVQDSARSFELKGSGGGGGKGTSSSGGGGYSGSPKVQFGQGSRVWQLNELARSKLLRSSWSFSMLSSPEAWQQVQTAHLNARAAALLQRRPGPPLKQRLLWHGARLAALAAPKLAYGTAAAAAASIFPVASAALPAGVLTVLLPALAALAPLLFFVFRFFLALPRAAVVFELTCCLIRLFFVPRTYTVGQQWVLTRQGMEPALRALDRYHRDWEEHKSLGGLFPGHRMIAYRNRLSRLLPGKRLMSCSSYRNLVAVAEGGSSAGDD